MKRILLSLALQAAATLAQDELCMNYPMDPYTREDVLSRCNGVLCSASHQCQSLFCDTRNGVCGEVGDVQPQASPNSHPSLAATYYYCYTSVDYSFSYYYNNYYAYYYYSCYNTGSAQCDGGCVIVSLIILGSIIACCVTLVKSSNKRKLQIMLANQQAAQQMTYDGSVQQQQFGNQYQPQHQQPLLMAPHSTRGRQYPLSTTPWVKCPSSNSIQGFSSTHRPRASLLAVRILTSLTTPVEHSRHSPQTTSSLRSSLQ
ncbi:hypothetical protein FGO68_gene1392 [Halteria grandinella]|uniref:Uncharacterized protein n=1 Tax=Halteria grandinella TaxID=5974 RepID=A0A8J8NK50_HALGN|nr:hypothetical protein FGO68_gene1392 [Halteria grandinella]